MKSQCRTPHKRDCRAPARRGESLSTREMDLRLESWRQAWLERELATASAPELHLLLRKAGDEAAAVAWATTFPALTLPELLAEKAQEARRHFQHQQNIRQRHQPRMSFAA